MAEKIKKQKGTDKKGRIKSPTIGKKTKTVNVRTSPPPKKIGDKTKLDKAEKRFNRIEAKTANLPVIDSRGEPSVVGSDKKSPRLLGKKRTFQSNLGRRIGGFRHGGLAKKMRGGGKVRYQAGGTVADNNPLADAGDGNGLSENQKKAIGEALGKTGEIAGQTVESFDATGRKGGTVGGATAGGALKGAGIGAGIGTAILPGVGTAIGAGVGAIGGGIAGFFKGKSRKRAREEQQEEAQQVVAAGGAGIEDAVGFTSEQRQLLSDEKKGRFGLGQRLERTFAKGGVVSVAKAKKILKDGSIKGNALTDKQKGLFGLIAGGGTPSRASGGTVRQEEDDRNIVVRKEEDDRNIVVREEEDDRNISFRAGGSVNSFRPRDLTEEEMDKLDKNLKNGGEIEGKGGPKSDSINATLKDGSFVVPAENALMAKALRKRFLGGGAVKAKLNQGGVAVKVSDGEELFTPEEVKVLEANNVNLNALAPNASSGNKLADGGTVDELRNQRELLLAKLGGKENEKTKALSAQISAAQKTQNQRDLKVELNRINALRNDIENQLQRTKDVEEAKALRDQFDKLTGLKTKAEGLSKSIAAPGLRPAGKEKQLELNAADIEALRTEFTDIQGTDDAGVVEQTTTDTPSDEKKVDDGSGGGVSTAQNQVGKNLNDANALKQKQERQATELADIEQKSIISQVAPDQVKIDAGIAETKKPDVLTDASVGVPGPDDDKGASNISNLVAGLGAVQTAGGIVGLVGAKKRPQDQISPELSEEFNKAQLDAGFGLTAQERGSIEQNIRAGRINAVDAIKATTTSPARSFGLIQSILAQGNRSRLDVEALNQRVKGQKVQRRAGLAGIIDQRKRQLFTDKLRAFEQNQAANAELLQSGLSNIIESQRLKIAQQKSDERTKPTAINVNV